MSVDRTHLLFHRSHSAPEAVIRLLEETLIGTNGTRYQLLDTRAKIQSLVEPEHIYILRNEKAIANATFCARRMSNLAEVKAFYIRYFAFDSIFQGGTKKGKANSSFHQYLKQLFLTSNLNPANPESKKSVYWAYIDPDNLRSFRMNERFGFQTIGNFTTYAFSRVSPKLNNVERIGDKDKAQVKEAIEKFYTGFEFFSPNHLFDNNNYFVLKENGTIICGIQANPCHWKIKELPGRSGKVLLKTAPNIPYFKRLLNPKNHRFLATEGLFWKEGYQDRIGELLEGTLALTNHYSALLWIDEKNPWIDDLDIKWGLLQQIKSNNTIRIVAKFNHFTEAEIQSIASSPKYLSGFDMT